MISTKNVKSTNNGVSGYMSYGTGEYKINSFEVQKAGTGAERVRMSMEGRPVNEPGFTGVDGALGKVGYVTLTSYMNPTSSAYQQSLDNFTRKMSEIADALGVREQLNSIEANSVSEFIAKASPLLCGKFTNWCIGAEEYINSENEVRYTLTTPLYGFVSSDASKLSFDKTKSYHYKPVEQASETPVTESKETW